MSTQPVTSEVDLSQLAADWNADHSFATSAPSISPIASVEESVTRFYPGLLPAVKCGLAVVCSKALSGRTKPIAVMFESPSGFGKSAVVQMFFPRADRDGNSTAGTYLLRRDNFTPKSFVSHAANVSDKKLREIDLLPQLKNKTLITKEMAPIFRGREEALQENFSLMIAVLDGKGMVTHSGTKGRRGYDETILFNWIGATTPIPPKTHRLMSQLGTRILFYEIPSSLPSEDELSSYVKCDDASNAEDTCQTVVNTFIVDFFRRHPIGSVNPKFITISNEAASVLVRLGLLVASGRREIHFERNNGQWTPVSAGPCEGPYKLVNYFKDLARAHALIHGRTEVSGDDLAIIRSLASGSIPHHLRPILRKLETSPEISSADVERLCSVTRPTARNYLRQLALTSIGELLDSAEESIPLKLRLSPNFSWLNPTLKTKCSV